MMEADLTVLDIFRLYVILGMDCLTTNHASMDCFKKEVTYRQPDLLEVVFQGVYKKPLTKVNLCVYS